MSSDKDHPKVISVLCIDDDDEYNFLTEDAFSECDFEYDLTFKTESTDALAYLASLKKFPDIILLDINMPLINGWEFLEEYESRNYHQLHNTTIFMHSSSVYEEDKVKAKTFSKVSAFVDKPIEPQKIMEIRDTLFP